MKISDKLLDIIFRTLTVESLTFGKTMLLLQHCPDHFTVRGIPGLNQYVNGRVEYQIKGRERITVEEREAVFLPAHEPIWMRNLDSAGTVSVWHSMHLTILDTIDPLDLLETPYKFGAGAGRKIGEVSQRLHAIKSSGQESFLELVVKQHQCAIELFIVILENSVVRENAAEFVQRTERIRPVLQYIQENYFRKVDTDDLARQLSLSAPRFFDVFREVMGISPGKYVQIQRMRKAQELLMSTGLRVYEVAERVGYEDVFHFSRLFKKNFRVSPENFRKQVF